MKCRMAHLFAILSTPVRMRESVFAVLIGTNTGIEVKEYASEREAAMRYRLLITCFRMAVEAPIELVVIDGETEYLALREKFDAEYDRRALVPPPVICAAVVRPSPFAKFAATISSYLA